MSIETSSCAAGSFQDGGIIDFQSLMINHLRFSLRSFFVPSMTSARPLMTHGHHTRLNELSAVSTYETDLAVLGREDFWLIVAFRGSEDETEIHSG